MDILLLVLRQVFGHLTERPKANQITVTNDDKTQLNTDSVTIGG